MLIEWAEDRAKEAKVEERLTAVALELLQMEHELS